MAQLDRPSPPGRYPVVVVGSGPGGLQAAYYLKRLRIKHAVISADAGAGGMFRKWPILQRLISWTKLYSEVPRHSRVFERYDWNSLIAETRSLKALAAPLMDGSTYFPARAEMHAALEEFERKARIRVRYDTVWEATRRDDDGVVLETSDGAYRCKVVIFAIGMTEPWKPAITGIDEVPHYAETKPPRDYSDKVVFIIGKRNSAFELADGLLPYVRKLILASPRPLSVSLETFHVASARARYLQPYEDYVLGGGSLVLDASITRIQRRRHGYRVHVEGKVLGGEQAFDADEVIAATGFTTPLRDLKQLGVATFQQDRLPALTPYWESVSVPGVYFAGSVSQGAPGLRKYGISSLSGAVQGLRYNAKVLVEHIARVHFGLEPDRPIVRRPEVVDFLLREATESPELWIQKSYLARALVRRGSALVDEGIVPLAHFVDDMGGPDGIAIAVETGPEGDARPAAYLRMGGTVREQVLPSNLHDDFATADHRAAISSLIAPLVVARRGRVTPNVHG